MASESERASAAASRSQQMLRLISRPNSLSSFNGRAEVRSEPLSVDGGAAHPLCELYHKANGGQQLQKNNVFLFNSTSSRIQQQLHRPLWIKTSISFQHPKPKRCCSYSFPVWHLLKEKGFLFCILIVTWLQHLYAIVLHGELPTDEQPHR